METKKELPISGKVKTNWGKKFQVKMMLKMMRC